MLEARDVGGEDSRDVATAAKVRKSENIACSVRVMVI
jgi:hypothetical protein